MKFIEGQNRYQMNLLPDCIEDYISEDNPVRVIDAFVDTMNLQMQASQELYQNIQVVLPMTRKICLNYMYMATLIKYALAGS